MSIETEISSLTAAIRNLTDVLLASAAKSIPTVTTTLAPSATVVIPYTEEVQKAAAEVVKNVEAASEPKKAVKKEPVAAPVSTVAPSAETATPAASGAPSNTASTSPEAPTVSEDDQRVQIVELARPNMADAAFKTFLGNVLSSLQGAACSISGTGKLPKIDAKHLPNLLAAINKQLGK
jgi:hypothetical protein